MKPDLIQSIAVVITTKIACPKTCHQLVSLIISEHFYNEANGKMFETRLGIKQFQLKPTSCQFLPEARVVGTVRNVQNTCHLPRRVCLHLNRKISHDLDPDEHWSDLFEQ